MIENSDSDSVDARGISVTINLTDSYGNNYRSYVHLVGAGARK